MKILHTSDLHIGKRLHEESLIDDQIHILKQIVDIAREKAVDAVLIAGDIYDRSDPSSEAYNVFNNFLIDLRSLQKPIMIISGNHDSVDRLNFAAELLKDLNIHIASIYNGKLERISIDDVDFYLMPFVRKFIIKDLVSKKEYEAMGNSANEVIKWVLNRETIDKNRKNILLMHQFVTSNKDRPELSDSESGSFVGTLDEVDADLFDDFDYVALGHIHRPQHIKRDTIRYSGSPLKYSFSEINNKNHVVIYDTDNKQIEKVELNPLREVIQYTDLLENILKVPTKDTDLVSVVLLDKERILSARNALERKF